MSDAREVISTFLDDEPFNSIELVEALSEPAGRDLLIDLIALRHLTQTDSKDAHVLNDHKPWRLRCAHLSQWRRFLSVWSAGISSASVDAT